jgi:MscS family membrane protein
MGAGMASSSGVLLRILLLAVAWPSAVHAQGAQSSAPTPPSVPPVPVVAADSPRAAFRAFRDASRAGRWDDAARFLVLPADDRNRGPELAQRLNAVIDSLPRLDPESISPASAGTLDDGLPADVEEIAQTTVDGVAEPIRLVRRSRAPGVSWAFAPASVARIDEWYGSLPTRWLRDQIIALDMPWLLRSGPLGILWWQLLALPFVGLVSWATGHGLRAVARPVIDRATSRTSSVLDDQIVASIASPMTLAFAVLAFLLGCVLLEVPRSALIYVASVTKAGLSVAMCWALWSLTRVLATWTLRRSWAANSASVRSVVLILSKISRGAIVGIGILAIMASFGYPISTVLAGLGIGALAIAFGAQKTIENLFGSISLAIDQPFRVGDLVKVQDFMGTVEDIGLRSTRFRTADRTLVSIPNGKLADERLESYEARDRMRLAATLGLTYGTTRDQLRTVLQGFERVLRSHPRIWPDAVAVSFSGFGPSSLDIEVMAWFQVPTWDDFRQCREEVLLGFMEVVEQAGTSFALPTRTVHVMQEGRPAFVDLLT